MADKIDYNPEAEEAMRKAIDDRNNRTPEEVAREDARINREVRSILGWDNPVTGGIFYRGNQPRKRYTG